MHIIQNESVYNEEETIFFFLIILLWKGDMVLTLPSKQEWKHMLAEQAWPLDLERSPIMGEWQ